MGVLTNRNIVIGLMLLQIAVCLPFINSFPIALDEPFSVFWAQQDVSRMLPVINDGNNSPLHFILLNGWIKVFGISPGAVRSLSLLFSILTIPVLYQLGRKLMSKEFAVFFVLVFIFSRFNHFHALEARMYSLLVLLTSGILLLAFRFIFEKKNNFLLLGVLGALIIYTHYLGLIAVSMVFFLTAVFCRGQEFLRYRYLAYAMLITGLLSIPALITFAQRFSAFSGEASWVPEPAYTELYGNILRFFNSTLVFALLFSFTALFLVLKNRERFRAYFTFPDRKKIWFVIWFFLLSYVGMFVFSKILFPIFLDRYLLFTTPALYLIFAFMVQQAFGWHRLKWLSFAMIVPLVLSFKPVPDNNREPDQIVKQVRELETSNSIVLIAPSYFDLTFAYHYDEAIFRDHDQLTNVLNARGIYGISNVEEIPFSPGTKRIILVDDNVDFAIPGNNINPQLADWGILVSSYMFKGGSAVYCYEKDETN
jgi:mannosyltransferase